METTGSVASIYLAILVLAKPKHLAKCAGASLEHPKAEAPQGALQGGGVLCGFKKERRQDIHWFYIKFLFVVFPQVWEYRV